MSPFPNARWLRRLSLAILVSSSAAVAAVAFAAERTRVSFPKDLDKLVHYTTVKRGNSTEQILTTQAAIDAVRSGREIPAGTHFVLADYRDGKVFRYFVMEKGEGWGADYDARRRTGDWHFQAFKPDRSVTMAENPARCQSCHQSRGSESFLYTFDELKRP